MYVYIINIIDVHYINIHMYFNDDFAWRVVCWWAGGWAAAARGGYSMLLINMINMYF